MAVVLTNGTCFIMISSSGGVRKTTNIEEAKKFPSHDAAIKRASKAPAKCRGYYPQEIKSVPREQTNKQKRKVYSQKERALIYAKANGCCKICGRKLQYENMTLDHIMPLSMGGTDGLKNLQASCLICNRIKSNIAPSDFANSINRIFVYQMKKKHKNKLRWRIAYKMLKKLL